jgi:hypothetical protein
MFIPRRRVRLLALGLAFALLAAQWALAGCACPLEQRAAAMAAMHAAGQPCEETHERQPVQCQQHMAAPSAETAKPLPALPDLVLAHSVPLPATEADADRAGPALLAAAQGPPAAPVYLATQRMRD